MQQQTYYMMSKTAIRRADGTGSAKAVFYLSNQRTDYCEVKEPTNAPRYTFSTTDIDGFICPKKRDQRLRGDEIGPPTTLNLDKDGNVVIKEREGEFGSYYRYFLR